MINFEQIEVASVPINEKKVKKWLLELVAKENKEIGEITYYFCNDKYMLEANREHLAHDFYTDVITFDASEGSLLFADILISLETVASNAEKFEVAFDEELHRVMAHGVLHLLGYKDKTSAQQKVMRAEEENALTLWNEIQKDV